MSSEQAAGGRTCTANPIIDGQVGADCGKPAPHTLKVHRAATDGGAPTVVAEKPLCVDHYSALRARLR